VRGAQEAEEVERLKRHRSLIAFYDTLSEEELQAYLRVRARIPNE
jgi:hypothetical protein